MAESDYLMVGRWSKAGSWTLLLLLLPFTLTGFIIVGIGKLLGRGKDSSSSMDKPISHDPGSL